MAHFQNFRTALGGFNREDVVRYIEYMNNQHRSQIEQLNTQLQLAKAELAKNGNAAELAAKLEAAEARCAQLEAELVSAGQPQGTELEAYRRAERAERMAGERVSNMYQQANGALADATARTEEISTQITEIADRVSGQLAELNSALGQSKLIMRSAASTMYAIRPLSDEE